MTITHCFFAILISIGFSSYSAAASLKSELKTLTDLAVENDFQLKKLNQDIKAAEAKVVDKKGNYLPSLTATAEISDDDSVASNSLNLDLNLFNGFADSLDLKSTQASLAVKKLIAVNFERRIRFQFSKKLLDLIDLFNQSEIQNQEVELRKSSLETMRQRFQRGLAPESEVLKLNVDYLNSQISLKEVEEKKSVAIEDLHRLTNGLYTPQKELKLPELPIDKPLSLPDLENKMVQQSLVLRQNQLELATEQALKKKAKWGLGSPRLDAFLNYDNSLALQSQTDPYHYESSAGLRLTLPIFSNLNDYSEWKVRQTNEKKAELTLAQSERELKIELHKVVENLKTLRETSRLQTENEKLASKFYLQSLERFRLGLSSTNDMSLDQQRLTQARLQLSQLKNDYLKSLLELNLLLGEPIELP